MGGGGLLQPWVVATALSTVGTFMRLSEASVPSVEEDETLEAALAARLRELWAEVCAICSAAVVEGAPLRAAALFWELVGPGGKLHPRLFLEYGGHLVIEALLVAVVLYLLAGAARKPGPGRSPEEELTEDEVDTLCATWEPAPLVPAAKAAPMPARVLEPAPGGRVRVVGERGGPALNMAAFNFLGIAGDEGISEAAAATINKYGVGSCGPRGFLGTIDVHLQLEEAIAKFMGTEEAIIYSYDLATVPSVIPAFANKKDLILVDAGANYAVRTGASLSRARVVFFNHNDPDDLEAKIKKELETHNRLKKPLNRRYICVEGIYESTGEICPLDRIFALKEKYKFRLVVDESLSFGVLGQRGRGVCEHYGLEPQDMPIVAASMGNALGSIGGFCCGVREIVDHQRLSGSGYVFSASLPPYLATAARGALRMLETDGARRLRALAEHARVAREGLRNVKGLALLGDPTMDAPSPVLHLALSPPLPEDAAERALQALGEDLLKREGVLVSIARCVDVDNGKRPPSLRMALSFAHSSADVVAAVASVRASAARVLF